MSEKGPRGLLPRAKLLVDRLRSRSSRRSTRCADRRQLIRAVIVDPDGDAPREAFAAWSVSHKDAQGTLARLQLAEARERRAGMLNAAMQWSRQAAPLILQYGNLWARDVLAIASRARFYRGFVEAITIDVPTFLHRAPELFDLAPIRSVIFVDAAPNVGLLAASPYLTRLVSLGFHNSPGTPGIGDDGLRTLVVSPYLGKLAMLSLGWNDIGLDGLEALAAATKLLPGLRYVRFDNNRVDEPTETLAIDPTTLQIDKSRVSLPPLGQALEAKYGELPWLHWPSRFPVFPPNEHDV